jgi:hypothetical protein
MQNSISYNTLRYKSLRANTRTPTASATASYPTTHTIEDVSRFWATIRRRSNLPCVGAISIAR